MKISILNGPKVFLKLNLFVILFLFFTNCIFIKEYIFTNSQNISSTAKFFWLDHELNLPTLYSGLCLLLTSFLSFSCSLLDELKKKEKIYWRILCAIFLFLTIDETVMIHERLNKLVYFFLLDKFELKLRIPGSWAILYSLVVILGALSFSKFPKMLPIKINRLFKFSFLIYVFGAIIVEILVTQILKLEQGSYTYFLFSSIEEILEMLGICLINHAILKYYFRFKVIHIQG